MKVAIVGNCQARPLSTALRTMAPEMIEHALAVVHLTKAEDHAGQYDAFAGADVILAQSVQDNYPVEHLRTQALKAAFPGKVVTWPNMFFAGQCPDIVYATAQGGRRISGPLRDYQFRPFFAAYQSGIGVEDCLRQTHAGSDDDLQRRAEASMASLRGREASLDTGVADLIEAEWKARRLFFTFNHPTAWLIIRLCERILDVLERNPEVQITSALLGEPLDPVVPPLLDRQARSLGFAWEASEAARGAEVSVNEGRLQIGAKRLYGLKGLAEASYVALDAQKRYLNGNVRITPE